MRRWEDIIGGLVFALFFIILFTGIIGFVLFWPRFPEDVAFVLGFLSFWLLANRLLFGYGQFINFAELLLEGSTYDRSYVVKKLSFPHNVLETLTRSALLLVWLRELDKYKYTYYTAFLLITLLSILFKFNLLGYGLVGNYIEGTFWGAAVVTFIVFALELIAHTYVEDLMSIEAKEVSNG